MEIRADTYLWAIRMYKSRTLAATAIKGGKVKINLPGGQTGAENIKPSHVVKIGERFTLTIGTTKKIIEVTALTEKRGSFEVAKTHYTDHSPPPEKKESFPSVFFKVNVKREKGAGRPTKKDRRDMNDFGWND
jgi:ribosome-associated heat shock protein Hsp15